MLGRISRGGEARPADSPVRTLFASATRACALVAATALVAFGSPSATRAAEPMTTVLDDATLGQIVPALPPIINLAVLDPVLAASLVPDSWIDSAITSARIVAEEKARPRSEALEPATWPVGPWSSAASLATSVRDLDPKAAAALYGALRPRITRRCVARGAAATRCEQEIQTTLERLGAPVVAARLAGRRSEPITDSQLEFARLGPQVVHVGRAKIEAFRRALGPR